MYSVKKSQGAEYFDYLNMLIPLMYQRNVAQEKMHAYIHILLEVKRAVSPGYSR